MMIFTESMERQLTPDLERRIRQALAEFPELAGRRIIVGTCRNRSVHGEADATNLMIGLNLSRRGQPTYYTIGHELTHLLQPGGLRVVPSGEVQCDIWTLARSDLFCDERPSYLRVPCRKDAWKHVARGVRDLCIEAIAMRRTERKYVVWLESRIRDLLAPAGLPLFTADGARGAAVAPAARHHPRTTD
ncbi:MAG: hypothetical protein HY660_13120 [Armatimonadetes bacterium]|nr:hypothetical protein [Armatimonadota bacterium]